MGCTARSACDGPKIRHCSRDSLRHRRFLDESLDAATCQSNHGIRLGNVEAHIDGFDGYCGCGLRDFPYCLYKHLRVSSFCENL